MLSRVTYSQMVTMPALAEHSAAELCTVTSIAGFEHDSRLETQW